MKKLGIFICAVALSTSAFSQVETQKKEEVKIESEVKVTEENGVKTVEVTSIEKNGEVRHEVFTGPAAEKKLAEMKKENIKVNARNSRAGAKKQAVKNVNVQTEEAPKKVH